MFRARHIGGPLDGEDLSLTSPRTPERLVYAPSGGPAVIAGHVLVGIDRAPDVRWVGQVEYVLDRASSDLRPHSVYDGMEVGLAVYVAQVERIACPACSGAGCEQCEGQGWVWKVPDGLGAAEAERQIAALRAERAAYDTHFTP